MYYFVFVWCLCSGGVWCWCVVVVTHDESLLLFDLVRVTRMCCDFEN